MHVLSQKRIGIVVIPIYRPALVDITEQFPYSMTLVGLSHHLTCDYLYRQQPAVLSSSDELAT